MDEIGFYLKAFITMLVLVNPLEGIPIYLAGTANVEPGLRNDIARRCPIAVTIILLTSLLLGKGMLTLFSISPGAFQIGGGAILFLISVQMILGPGGGETFAKMAGGQITRQFAIVPLAIPICAGPGAINGAVLYGSSTKEWWQLPILAVVIMLVGVATYLFLRAAQPLVKYLKETGIGIATRIMGLIIAAISAEMILQGIAGVFGLRLMENVSSM